MISITSAELNAWLAAFIWPLTRVLAVIASAPVLGDQSLPMRVKIGLAALVTLIVAPTLGPLPQEDPGSAAGLLILAQQLVIGLAIGFAMRIVFVAVEMAGEIAGLQMGLGFASFYDPQNFGYTPVIGKFLGLLTTLVFLSVNGHLMVLAALAESFHAFPVSAEPLSSLSLRTLVEWGGKIFLAGLLLSLPLLAALLIANLALGILTRAAPQLNLFAVGFPVTLSIGLLVLAVSLPYLASPLTRLIDEGLHMMLVVAQQARAP